MELSLRCLKCGGIVTVPANQEQVFCSKCGCRLNRNQDDAFDQIGAQEGEPSVSDEARDSPAALDTTPVAKRAERTVVVVPLSVVVGVFAVLIVVAVGVTVWLLNSRSRIQSVVAEQRPSSAAADGVQARVRFSDERDEVVQADSDQRIDFPNATASPIKEESEGNVTASTEMEPGMAAVTRQKKKNDDEDTVA